MSTIRCFTTDSTKLISGTKHLLSQRESHHLVSVLRVRSSDSVLLMNGHGEIANTSICGRIGGLVELLIKTVTTCKRSRLVLCIGLLKNKAMDLVIRDAAAIGVAKILPLLTERTEVKFDQKSAESKLLHWKAIAIEACKQSGEAFLPEILGPMGLETFLNGNKNISLVAGLYHHGEKYLIDYQSEIYDAHTLNLIVGPEGDFSPGEYEMLLARGTKVITLTQNILRSETAALYLLSLVDQMVVR